ncbi:MAG: nucleotidyl transferase AbiEii/AbiGii toxin family protein [Candidatus Bathycorpusculaceae bacterium]
MSLIHNEKYFTKEEILERARKYEFPNPLAVEIFLWDCELAAQLQDKCDDIVLKGGAAAQLHLPLEKQRGSIDIDVFTPLNKSGIAEIVQGISQSLEGNVEFELHKPKKPIPKLPLITYYAKVPSKTDPTRKELEIKIDIFLKSPNLPTIVLNNVQTFAVDVQRMKCFTVGTLIGDKLLTLAEETIGMTLKADYPKQIYDIDALLEVCEISKNTVSDMVESVEALTKLEASIRNIKTTPTEALHDVIKTMDKYSLVDTSGGDASIKKNIDAFQQFFVNKNQRSPFYGWSSKSLKIKFLATLISKYIENILSESDVAKVITQSKVIAARLNQVSGKDVIEVRKKLLNLAQTKIPYFKEMKGKTLDRVFWQIVTLENLQDIESIL